MGSPPADNPEHGPLLSAENAAKQLDCFTRTIRRLIASGQLTGIRVGDKMLRVPQAEVNAIGTPIRTVGQTA